MGPNGQKRAKKTTCFSTPRRLKIFLRLSFFCLRSTVFTFFGTYMFGIELVAYHCILGIGMGL